MSENPHGSDRFEADTDAFRFDEEVTDPDVSRHVVSAIDEAEDGAKLVIADVDDDEAWISMDADLAATLSDWH